MPVSRDDQRRLAVVDVAGGRRPRGCSPGTAGRQSSSEVVALEGVLDRAGEIGRPARRSPCGRRTARGRPRPDRRRTGCRHAAAPRTRPGRARLTARPTTASTCRASSRRPPRTRIVATCARSRSPSSASDSRCARLESRRIDSRSIRCTGSSASRPAAWIARTCFQCGDLQLVHPDGAGDRVLPQLRDQVGPARRRSPPAVRRAACRPSTSPGRRPRPARRRTDGSSAGIPLLVRISPEPTS